MSVLFFFYALLIGWLAWNVHYPRYSGSAVVISFMSGFVVGELALHQIALQLFFALGFMAWGGLWGPLGSLALLICVVSWASLAVHHQRGFAVGETAEAALKAGLGDDYLEYIDADLRAQFPARVDVGLLVSPFTPDLPGVEILKDIPYGDHGRRVDIYRKAGHGQRRPVLLQIHGGAWTEKLGSKNEQARPLMNHLALRDWICVAIEYRLSPRATMPEHLIDCKQALVWIRDHIEEYGGDPDFVIATGGSAGGHLSALLSLTANDPAFQPGFADRDTSVSGCIPFYGALDFINEHGLAHNPNQIAFLAKDVIKKPLETAPELWRSVSPMQRLHADAPPFLVICGDKDSLVPVRENERFARELAKASSETVCYIEVAGAQHAFDLLRSPRTMSVILGIERWLAFQYSRYRAAQAPS